MSRRLLASVLALAVCSHIADGHAQTAPAFQGSDAWERVEEQRAAINNELAQLLGVLISGLADEEARTAKRRQLKLGVALSFQPACNNAARLAHTAFSGSETVIWICADTLIHATFLIHAAAIATAEYVHLKRTFAPRKMEMLLDYYAKVHVRRHSEQVARQAGNAVCTPWNAAFLLSGGKPFSDCQKMAFHDPASLQWTKTVLASVLSNDSLAEQGTDAVVKLLDTQRGNIYLGIAAIAIAHEIAHIVYPPAQPRSDAYDLAMEKAADDFSLRLVASHGKDFEEAVVGLPMVQIYLARIAVDVQGKGMPLDQHLMTRSLATARQIYCAGGQFPSFQQLLRDSPIQGLRLEHLCK